MPAKKKGTDGQLYRNTNTWASPSWSVLAVRDLKFTDKPAGTFDSSDRSIDVNTKVPTRSEWEVEFEFYHDASDTGLVALITAATTGRASGIELLVTDNAVATSGAKGLRAEWLIETGWDNDMKLVDGQLVKMKLTPHGNYTNAPVRWTT